MNHLKITGHLDASGEAIVAVVKGLLGSKYRGYTRFSHYHDMEDSISFPIWGLTAKEEWVLLEKIHTKITQTESIQNGEKILVSIDAD